MSLFTAQLPTPVATMLCEALRVPPPPTSHAVPLDLIRDHLQSQTKDDLVYLCVELLQSLSNASSHTPATTVTPMTNFSTTPPLSVVSPPFQTPLAVPTVAIEAVSGDITAILPPPKSSEFDGIKSIDGASLRARFMNGNDVLELPRVDPLMSSSETTNPILAATQPAEVQPVALSPHLLLLQKQHQSGKGLKRVVSTANVTLQSTCWSDDDVPNAAPERSRSDETGSPLAHGSSGTLAESYLETPSRSSVHRRHVLPPELINDKFEVYGRLSAGRTADVFHALDLENGVACAIKAIPRKHVRYLDTGVPREAEALLRVEHPNVSRLRSCIDDPSHDNVYLVLDLVENCSPLVVVDAMLGTAVSNVPAEALPRVVLQICAALQCMHSKHVVHGDLKPDNVVVAPEPLSFSALDDDTDESAAPPPPRQIHVTILDLGAAVFCERRRGMLISEHAIHLPYDPAAAMAAHDETGARSVSPTPMPFASPGVPTTESEADGPGGHTTIPVCLRKGVTSTGLTCVEPRRRRATRMALREAVRRGTQTSQGGAALFSAPELFDGAMPTQATDVWAFGVLLFAAIYGSLPFFGTSATEVRDAVLRAQPRFPSGDLSPEQRLWRPIVRGMLEPDPFDRMKLVDVRQAALSFMSTADQHAGATTGAPW